MSTLLGDARIRIRPDMTGFEREASRGIGSAVKKAAALAATVAAGALAAGAASYAKDAIAVAEAASTANARLDQVLSNMGLTSGEASKRVQDYARSLSMSTGVMPTVIKDAQGVLATFEQVALTAGDAGGSFDRATAAAVDMSATLGMDVSSAAMMLGKALNDPIQGVTALRRSGVQLTEEQKKQVEAFVEVGDAAGAQNLILSEIEKQVGGTAGATANASDKMAVALANVKERVGTALLPAFTSLTESVIRFADEHGPSLERVIGQIVEQAVAFARALMDVAKWIGENRDIIVPTAAALAAMVAAFKAYKMIATAVTAVQVALNIAMAANPIGLVALAIAGLVAAFVALYQRNEGFRNFIQGIWQGIKDFMAPIISWFAETIPPIWDKIFQAVSTAMSAIWSVIKTVWDFIYPFVTGYLKLLFTAFTTLWGTIFRVVAAAMEGIWNVIKTVWDFIYPAVSTYLQLMWTVYSTYFKAVWTVISTVMKAIWAVISAIWGVIGPFITGVLKEIWSNVQSIWNLMWEIISRVLGWIWDKVKWAFDAIKNQIEYVMDAVRWIWDNVLSRIWNKAVEIFNAVTGKIGDALDRVRELFRGAVTAIGAIWDSVTEVVKRPIRAMFDWINRNMIDPINRVLGVFSDEVKLGKLPAFADGGPVSGRGGPRDDRIPALLSNGEYVINAASAKRYGPLVEAINADRQGFGIGGPLDFIGAAMEQVTEWAMQGAAFALGKVLDPALDALDGAFGESWSGRAVTGVFRKASDAVKAWGSAEDAARRSAAAVTGGAYLGPPTGVLSTPLPGSVVTSEFRGPGRPNHMGIDLGAPMGTPIYAAGAGAITMSGWNGGYGNYIRMDHGGGLNTAYGHMSQIIARAGQTVAARALIGLVGSTGDSTGPHLHFEVLQNGSYLNPRSMVAFDQGGYLQPGWSMAYNGTGKPEPVLTDKDWKRLTGAQTGATINITNYYPQAEPTSETTARALRVLSMSGGM